MTLVISKGITLANSFAVEDYMWNNPRAHGLLDVGSIGDPFEGGFYAGVISHTADGNPTHALIVAPAAIGATGTGYALTTALAWKTANTTTANTTSDFDGAANTAAMVTAGISSHPAAEFCVNLSIGGRTDWYLPARWELDIAYFNLKPTTASNSVGAGANPYSVPRRDSPYTAENPAQTPIPAFLVSQAEAFVDATHWSSTEAIPTAVWNLFFDTGVQGNGATKTLTNRRTRAFRRIAL
jgi:hypothetical protein